MQEIAAPIWWHPLVPLVSAIGGGVVAIIGQIVVHWHREKPQRLLEEQQKRLLEKMLKKENMPILSNGKRASWRNFSTLSSVIGADDAKAKRLLIEIGARRSAGAKDVWALIHDKPLDEAEREMMENG